MNKNCFSILAITFHLIVISTEVLGASLNTIFFDIENRSVTASKLHHMSANNGDVLKWDDSSFMWVQNSLNQLNYKQNWDARTVGEGGSGLVPDSSPNTGDVYFVSESGSINLSSINSWTKGDWAIYNGTVWEKVESSVLIPSVFGRAGPITAQANDYTWEQINKANSSVTDMSDVNVLSTPGGENFLIWNESTDKWEAASVSGLLIEISENELATDSINSSKIEDNSLTNSDISATATIGFSKLNIEDNDLTIAQTDGLQAALDDKLSIFGGTFTNNLNMNNYNITNVETLDGIDIAALDSSVSANSASVISLNTASVTEVATLGGLYFTDSRVRIASVVDTLTDIITDIAPSQNAVHDALSLKQDAIDSSSNIDLNSLTSSNQDGIIIEPYGTGASETGEIHLLALDSSNYVAFRAPDLISSDVIWTLPEVDGITGQVLMRYDNGVISWAGGVTDVLANTPIISSGGSNPEISLTQASSTDGGYLLSNDWNRFNNKMEANSNLTTIIGLSTTAANFVVGDGTNWSAEASAAAKISLGLGNVENIPLSTWSGLTSIETLGAISSGTWQGNNIGIGYLPIGGNWTLSSDLNINSNNLAIDYFNNRVGIGTATPVSKLTVEGFLSLREDSSPGASTDYGKLYVKSSDSNFYFMDDSGFEFNFVTKRNKSTSSKTSNYTVTTADNRKVFLVTGSTTITLPPVATAGNGFTVLIKNVDATNIVSIDGDGTEAIDGSEIVELKTQYSFKKIVGDEISWHTIAEMLAPECSFTSGIQTESDNTSEVFGFSCTDVRPITSYECKLDTGAYVACDTSSSYTVNGLGEQEHTIYLRSTNNGGHTSTEVTRSWTTDFTSPVCTITTPISGTRNNSSETINFSCSDANTISSVECRKDSGSWISCDTATSHTISGLIDGAHSFEVRATDIATHVSNVDISNWTTNLCTPDCSCASSTIVGETCSDGCSGTCAGTAQGYWRYIGAVVDPDPPADTCPNQFPKGEYCTYTTPNESCGVSSLVNISGTITNYYNTFECRTLPIPVGTWTSFSYVCNLPDEVPANSCPNSNPAGQDCDHVSDYDFCLYVGSPNPCGGSYVGSNMFKCEP